MASDRFKINEAEKTRKLQEFKMLNPDDSTAAAKDYQRWESNEKVHLENLAQADKRKKIIAAIIGGSILVIGIFVGLIVYVHEQNVKQQSATNIASLNSSQQAKHDASVAAEKNDASVASSVAASSEAAAKSNSAEVARAASEAAAQATADDATKNSDAADSPKSTLSYSNKAKLENFLVARGKLANLDLSFETGEDLADYQGATSVIANTVNGDLQMYGHGAADSPRGLDMAVFYPNEKLANTLTKQGKKMPISYYLFSDDGTVYQRTINSREQYDGTGEEELFNYTYSYDGSDDTVTTDKVFAVSKDTAVIKYYDDLLN
ncbi:hypothetical protein EQG49_04150 [Periweissella cryptocerci]|uniref:Uncharacterized protein n=1 Tax=Periweissella cryptocerci TaxID=2506420 RepID=A0A4P6YSL6_9LACO|nr:hypothetical protein [Periweissella cryptocerci]QBO35709.1 hypothetical protein EQG49_04150 [Periweissella cryptocerci]